MRERAFLAMGPVKRMGGPGRLDLSRMTNEGLWISGQEGSGKMPQWTKQFSYLSAGGGDSGTLDVAMRSFCRQSIFPSQRLKTAQRSTKAKYEKTFIWMDTKKDRES